ncbi:putative oxidoreductase YgfK [bioreactor metagenome]|uniref:Putative oxidoreductase YgfK n=1 Tax=bioreactor metagenome TaxID=1076179 RepID=A0A644W995_9ZZZZ
MAKDFHVISFEQLLSTTLENIDNGHFMGIPTGTFAGKPDSQIGIKRFGHQLDTPVGVAAGPHSQLAQNIVAAWLCGARYIELKTVQTLDELDVSKPCIDMQDEGYNCEWSQELKIDQSFGQYLDAWILVHLLNHKLYGSLEAGAGTIFNMSVGYNMEGILKDNVQWFFSKMKNCSVELAAKMEIVRKFYPEADKLDIPARISDNITLSTMHGCPPDEIEKIGLYLIKEKKLHTTIKLNPTLLRADMLRWILNGRLGFSTVVPDEAFAHDLKYPDALNIIRNLDAAAKEEDVFFGLKLTNTLESMNIRGIFPENEKMNYMSGRALHPVSVHLAAKLQAEFDGMLDISFSAGADAFNIVDLLRCGLGPVTMSSDLLKPGGYGRLSQYVKNVQSAVSRSNTGSLGAFICAPGKMRAVMLKDYTSEALENPAYRKAMREPTIKTTRKLGHFDCIHAPCVNTCPDNQNIPQYLYHVSNGDFQKAFEVIMATNPFPSVTGAVCDHACQTRCTRINYDENLAIREVKRWVAEKNLDEAFIQSRPKNGQKAAIIGAGPAGMSCAYFLLLAGFEVEVFEEKHFAGGMAADVIPAFRLKNEAIDKDIRRIENLGVKVHYGVKIDRARFNQFVNERRFVFIATGTPTSKKLGVKGDDAVGVKDPLVFLSDLKKGNAVLPGRRVLVIGGGNTAMDVARAAKRMQGGNGSVIVVYRRRLADMPAEAEEILAARAENIEFVALKSPLEVVMAGGKVGGLRVATMKVTGVGSDGRAKVEAVPGSEEILIADAIFPAIGQDAALDFIDVSMLKKNSDNYGTMIDRVFIGGDVRKGPASIIAAIGDGRRAAEAIIAQSGNTVNEAGISERNSGFTDLMLRKAKREKSQLDPEVEGIPGRIIHNDNEAVKEASRCLLCDEVCNICVTVCPNLANQSYESEPFRFSHGDFRFELSQKVQTYNIGEFCNECGNCRTFCPTSGAPYMDKPRVWISREAFDKAVGGYHFTSDNGNRMLIHKTEQGTASIKQTAEEYVFVRDNSKLKFNLRWEPQQETSAADLTEVMGMRVLWGIKI